MDAPVNAQLEPISFLLGTWRGSGRGVYPTIEDFAYEEESVFGHTGRPFLVYSQRTWQPDTGRPMHSETGFIRVVGEDLIEIVISHAFGIAELGEGTVSGSGFATTSTSLSSTATAKNVDAVSRRYELVDGELRYSIGMAFGGHPLQGHLEATLRPT